VIGYLLQETPLAQAGAIGSGQPGLTTCHAKEKTRWWPRYAQMQSQTVDERRADGVTTQVNVTNLEIQQGNPPLTPR
jgi:hypothetical protein